MSEPTTMPLSEGLQRLLDDLDMLSSFIAVNAPRFEAGARDPDALLCRLLLNMHACGRIQACMERDSHALQLSALANAPVGGNA